jgi:hypothetical protein
MLRFLVASIGGISTAPNERDRAVIERGGNMKPWSFVIVLAVFVSVGGCLSQPPFQDPFQQDNSSGSTI